MRPATVQVIVQMISCFGPGRTLKIAIICLLKNMTGPHCATSEFFQGLPENKHFVQKCVVFDSLSCSNGTASVLLWKRVLDSVVATDERSGMYQPIFAPILMDVGLPMYCTRDRL